VVLRKSYLNEVNFVRKLLNEDFITTKLVFVRYKDLIYVYMLPSKKKFIVKGDLNKLLELIEKNFSVLNVEDEINLIYEIAKK